MCCHLSNFLPVHDFNTLRRADDQETRASDKKACLHDSRNLAQPRVQVDWISDLVHMEVEDIVLQFGDKSPHRPLTQDRLDPHRPNLLGHVAPPKPHDLDGERKWMAEYRHAFG